MRQGTTFALVPLIGLGIFWQQVVKGLVLLAAVYVDVYQKNKG